MEPITLQSAALFLGGILIHWLAAKYAPGNPAPVAPVVPGTPAVPAPVPQLGDGHILKELLAQLVIALQQSQPVKLPPGGTP